MLFHDLTEGIVLFTGIYLFATKKSTAILYKISRKIGSVKSDLVLFTVKIVLYVKYKATWQKYLHYNLAQGVMGRFTQ